MGQIKSLEALNFDISRRFTMRRQREADVAQWSNRLRWRDLNSLCNVLTRCVRFPVSGQGDCDDLRNSITGIQTYRKWQPQRRAVGLIAGVNPIALVFHLEGVTFHQDADGHTRHNLMRDGANVKKWLMG